MREHNRWKGVSNNQSIMMGFSRLATQLKRMNPRWSDETVYQVWSNPSSILLRIRRMLLHTVHSLLGQALIWFWIGGKTDQCGRVSAHCLQGVASHNHRFVSNLTYVFYNMFRLAHICHICIILVIYLSQGNNFMKSYGLFPLSSGFSSDYSDSFDPR